MPRIRIAAVAVITGALLAVAITSSASGGGASLSGLAKQLKSLKKKVAVVQKQQGPAGTNGAPGTPGTARAYGSMFAGDCSGADPAPCVISRGKGITSITRTSDGYYCVVATGINPATTTPVVGVDWGSTAGPEGNASAMSGGLSPCAGGFQVTTERLPDTAPITALPVNNVSFTIMIP
jgi:hypothetical protein